MSLLVDHKLVLIQQALAKLSLNLERSQLEKLDRYLDLLVKWNKTYNLTAIKNKTDMLERHLIDSLSVVRYIEQQDLLDVGSGAGLPGIPLSILFPEKKLSLLDSNGKKTRFLNHAKRTLALNNVTVLTERVESLQVELKFSAIISRAFSDIGDMIDKTKHLLQSDGVIYAMKGQYPQMELANIDFPYHVEKLTWQGIETQRHLVVIEIK